LKTARDAYAKASSEGAAQGDPASTRDAQQALEAAEAAHSDDAGSEQERTQAYVAQRKSELAMARAEESRARDEREEAEQQYQAGLERELSAARHEVQLQQAASDKAKKEAAGWRKRGEDLVITLSGVIFQTGGHELTADVKRRLDAVAQAAKEYPERGITIAGYTDSKGREDANLALSQKRADAVKAYLESRGVAGSRINSVGHGEDSPVASNDTVEGRAENRRVEITLDRAGALPERQPVRGIDSEPMQLSKPK
jgi:outer membrane protein OmpA-like peptidoglycan-associated protein